MMVHEDAIPRCEGTPVVIARCLPGPYRDDLSGGLMPQNQGRLPFDVPRHDIAAADSGRVRTYQQLALAEPRNGDAFDRDILDAAQHRHAHLVRIGRHPTPRSRL